MTLSDKPLIKPDYCAASVTDYCNCRGCLAEAALAEARQERDSQYEFNIGQIATQAALEQQLSEAHQKITKLEAEIKSGDEMYEAQQQKYADCPHKPILGEVNECGCSFDHISHTCDYHAPALKAAKIQVTQQAATIAECRQELVTNARAADEIIVGLGVELRQVARLKAKVDEQEATISQLRDALEKAKQGLETVGMGARYIDQALASIPKEPTVGGDVS